MDLTGLIISSEKQYKNILEEFFLTVYDSSVLPSHGLDHHRRVWRYAVEIIRAFDEKSYDHIFTDSLIIASYLHDAGMAYEPGPKHGWKSAELCLDFLRLNNLDEKDFPGLLYAITEHDNKEYPEKDEDHLLKILSLADDLDAFGYTGIYRYTEIYYLRGIEFSEIGTRIIENATCRFSNFEQFFRDKKQLVSNHRKRFDVLYRFFKSFSQELEYSGPEGGHRKVVGMIIEMINSKGILKEIAASGRYDNDPVVSWYFENLYSECD